MIIFYWMISFVILICSGGLEAKSCKLTDVLVHKHGYSHQYVLHSNCPLDHSEMAGGKDNEVHIFIPVIVKDEGIKKSIEKVNSQASSSYYSMKMLVKDNGIQCVININPNNLHASNTTPLELQKTTSITGNHGLLIKLHDTKALSEMEAKSASKRITRLAYADLKKKPTIVVDFGHGGKDSGYSDKFGLQEKHINKLIGDKVVQLLKKKVTMSV